MGIAGSLMIISIAWWLAFIALLPFGDRTQTDEGTIVPGTDPSAPVAPRFRGKALGALLIALIAWAFLYWLIEIYQLKLRDIAWLTGG
jgi:predicted secreted protein